jgi:hypothetical protein
MPKGLVEDGVQLEKLSALAALVPVSSLVSEEVLRKCGASQAQAPACSTLHPLSVPKIRHYPLVKALWVLGRLPVVILQ